MCAADQRSGKLHVPAAFSLRTPKWICKVKWGKLLIDGWRGRWWAGWIWSQRRKIVRRRGEKKGKDGDWGAVEGCSQRGKDCEAISGAGAFRSLFSRCLIPPPRLQRFLRRLQTSTHLNILPSYINVKALFRRRFPQAVASQLSVMFLFNKSFWFFFGGVGGAAAIFRQNNRKLYLWCCAGSACSMPVAVGLLTGFWCVSHQMEVGAPETTDPQLRSPGLGYCEQCCPCVRWNGACAAFFK